VNYEELRLSITGLATELSRFHLEIAKQQEPVVSHLLRTKSRDVQAIEGTLERLLDVACHDAGLTQFRRLCRYYFRMSWKNRQANETI